MTPRRFTPTGVGTILFGMRCRCRSTVHPHGRGDNRNYRRCRTTMRGSPPRAWGQCSSHVRDARRRRFTPTGVGTISSSARPIHIDAVHPHGRGDNERNARSARSIVGSPPRAWGQL